MDVTVLFGYDPYKNGYAINKMEIDEDLIVKDIKFQLY